MWKDRKIEIDVLLQKALDALRADLNSSQAMKRDMVEFLMEYGFWDRTQQHDSAMAKFNSCLDPNKPLVTFNTAQIVALTLVFDRHCFVEALAEMHGGEIHYRHTEDRRDKLLHDAKIAMQEGTKAMQQLAAQLQLLDGSAEDVRVHPAIAAGSAHFSMPDQF